MNFMLAIAAYLIGDYAFSAVNLVPGTYALHAFGDLDGAQIVRVLTEQHKLPSCAQNAALYLSMAFVSVISVATWKSIGFTFFVTSIYMLILGQYREARVQ